MINLSHQEILELEKRNRVSLINKITGIKSANLIGTRSKNGTSNLAIFNSVIHIGANPPLLGFITRPLTVDRHTYRNIRENKYFTINQVTRDIIEKAHQTSAKYAASVSEFTECGLTEEVIDEFPAPFVQECIIKIGMSYVEEYLIGVNQTILVIGKVENICLPEGSIGEDGDIDLEKTKSMGVGGLDTYYSMKRIGRLKYARVNKLDR